jgi:hypothetical protein
VSLTPASQNSQAESLVSAGSLPVAVSETSLTRRQEFRTTVVPLNSHEDFTTQNHNWERLLLSVKPSMRYLYATSSKIQVAHNGG